MSEVERLLEVKYHEDNVLEGVEKNILMESAILNVKRRKEATNKMKRRRVSVKVGFNEVSETRVVKRKKIKSNYFFDYNTVELILLGCAIVVCAAGIMFTTGKFDDDRQVWQQDLIGTVVVIIITLSLIYYFVVVIAELCGDEEQCGCVHFLVKCFGSQDKNAKLLEKVSNNIDDGDIEMNENPLQNRGIDQKELLRIKKEQVEINAQNNQLKSALRNEKNKNAQHSIKNSKLFIFVN